MRMARLPVRLPVGLPVMEVGTYHLKRMMMGLGPCLVKKSQRSLDRRLPVEHDRRLPVEQGGRKPPGEAAAAADDDKLTPSGQMQTFSLR